MTTIHDDVRGSGYVEPSRDDQWPNVTPAEWGGHPYASQPLPSLPASHRRG